MIMAKMSKKTAITGAIIVMIVWFAIWFFAIRYLNNQTKMASNRGFINDAVNYISADADFNQTYGKLTEVTPEAEEPTQNESATTKEYYMDFTCITESGTHRVRVFQYWNAETESWNLRYEALPAK